MFKPIEEIEMTHEQKQVAAWMSVIAADVERGALLRQPIPAYANWPTYSVVEQYYYWWEMETIGGLLNAFGLFRKRVIESDDREVVLAAADAIMDEWMQGA